MKLLLWILIVCLPILATTRTWDGSSNNKWSDTTNWSEGLIPTASDSAVFNSTGDVACSLDVDASILFLKIAASYTKTWKAGGRVLTTVNGISDSGVTGVHTGPDSLVMPGDGKIRFSSGVATLGWANSVLDLQGNDTLQIIPISTTVKSIYCAYSGKNTVFSGTGSSSGFNTKLSLGSGILSVNNNTFGILTNPTAAIVVDTNHTINGTASILCQVITTSPTTWTLPRLKFRGGYTRFRIQHSVGTVGNSLNVYLSAQIDSVGAFDVYNQVAGGTHLNLNGYAIIGTGDFLVGNSSSVGYDSVTTGNGLIKCGSWGTGQVLNGVGGSVIDLGSSQVICEGSFTWQTNQTALPGTSLVTITNTSTITSAGKHFYQLKDSSGSATVTFADAPYIEDDFTVIDGATTWAGYTMTVGGDLVIDGTRTHNFGTGITMTGASALLHVGDLVGTVTATSCALTWNGANGTFDNDKGLYLKLLTLGANASVTNSGLALTNTINNGPCLVFTDGGTLTLNQQFTINVGASGDAYSVLAGSATINGGSIFNIRSNAVGLILNLPALAMSGTTTLNIRHGSSFTGTFIQTGDISAVTVQLVTASTGTTMYRSAGYSLTASTLSFGANSAESTFMSNWGGSIITASSVNSSSYNTGTSIIDSMGTSQWRCSGNWTFGSNHTVVPGTSTVQATGTGTWTTLGKSFYNLKCDMPPTSTMTIADSVVATNFYHDSGLIAGNKPFRLTNLYCNTDSTYMGGALTIADSGSINIKATKALRITAGYDISGSAGKNVRIVSQTPGTQARLYVPADASQTYGYWKDVCVSGGVITCPWTSGCRSGGGGKCP